MKKVACRVALLFAFVLMIIEKGNSQTPDPQQKYYADSVLFLLNKAPVDTNRINLLNNLTTYLSRIRDYDQVFKYASEALELSKKLNFKKGLKGAYQKLAMAYGVKNNYEEALKYNFLLLELEEATGNKWVSGTYNEIGAIYYDQGKYRESLDYLLKAKDNLEDYIKTTGIDKKDGKAFLSKNIGLIYEKFGEPDKALEQYYSALRHWQEGKEVFDSIYISDSYGLIGNVLKSEGKYDQAVKYYSDALLIAEKIQKSVALMSANRNLGLLNSTQGNYPEALNYFMKALTIAENRNFPNWIAELNNDIGNLYISEKNYTEALKHFKVAETNAETGADKQMLSSVYISMGILYSAQNSLEESIAYNNKARAIAEEFNNKEGQYTANHNIGLIYYKQAMILGNSKTPMMIEKLSAAFRYQKAALEITHISGIRLQEAHVDVAMGSILCKLGRIEKTSIAREKYKDGIASLNKGLGVAIEFNDKELIKDAYSALYEAYRDANDYKKAFYYSKLYISLNDSLLSDQSAKKIEQIRIQYAADKAVNEEKLRQENEKAQMEWVFSKKEDSIKFQQKLMSMQMMQQAMISNQREQELELKQSSLDLINKQNELNHVNFLKSQAELGTEQVKRKEKENELTIANQEKSLQSSQLALQKIQLNLKENQIKSEKRQRLFYIGAIVLLVLLFGFIYYSIKNRQKSTAAIAVERLRAAKAGAAHKMIELELQSLRAQLNPHFMFNSLNAIQELILTEDNERSHVYLSAFSDLLRMLLDNVDTPFISLKKEIGFLELYLSLESLRIPNLEYAIKVDPGISMEKTKIPNMMLQPYIENAIWHGLSHKKENRSLLITVDGRQNAMAFEIRDNGIGRKKATELKSQYRKEHKSKGMELLSKRFNLLSKEYATDIQTTVTDLYQSGEASGTLVEIIVPLSLSEKLKESYGSTYDHN